MRPTYKRAFSLIELLVVAAILSLLVSIMIPMVSNAKAIARKAVCQSNLHHIYVAYSRRKQDEKVVGRHVLRAKGWQGELIVHLGDEQQALYCPEDRDPALGGPGSIGGGTGGGGGGGGGGATVEVIGKGYDMPLEEGPLTKRKNKGGDSYELHFEDIRPGGGDMDFNDLVLLIEPKPDGSVDITFVSKSAGYKFNLVGADGEILMEDIGGKTKKGTTVTIQGGLASYGMNSLVDQIDPGQHVILLLDYERLVASVAGPDAEDNWNDWLTSGGGYVFARHRGRCNVLFADGSVSSMLPITINPDLGDQTSRYWEP
jgi:prepilin-type processing-associated H-X9-DG protein/prepilin-type N-terminal cleavage/methylation domain-containing protein